MRRCLESLRRQQPEPVRIIVVDNGSTDDSIVIAEELADEVLPIHQGSISHLRNTGAAALGEVDVIAFIDADVELSDDWLAQGLAELRTADLVGSRNGATPGGPWIATRWAAIEANTAHPQSHVWSQSLLLTADLFRRLGGFDEDLPTGEDSDLSARTVGAGRVVRASPAMHAIHHGFPTTIRAFLRRERWHTRNPGWFGLMSNKSRLLVLTGVTWAGVGAVSAVAAVAGRPRALFGWSALTAAAVPALGKVVGPGDDPFRDGVLLGIWTGVRVARFPNEPVVRRLFASAG